MKPGYVYVVKQRQSTSLKIGYTTLSNVARYIHDNYSRALSPLQVLLTFPAANARLAEASMHNSLHRYRLDPRHELFDLGSDNETVMHLLREAQIAAEQHDARSGILPPQHVHVDVEQWRADREYLKEQAAKNKRLAIAEAKAEAEAVRTANREKRTMRQQIKAKLAAEAYERKLRDKVEAGCAKCEDLVSSFVESQLTRTGCKEDVIDANTLYTMFQTIFPQETKRKTMIGKRKWFDKLQQKLTLQGYAEEPRTCPDGCRKRRTWVGWKASNVG